MAHHLGYRRIDEAPIRLDYKFESTITPRAVFDILWDTAAIFYRLRLLRYYDRRRRELAVRDVETVAQPQADGSNRI